MYGKEFIPTIEAMNSENRKFKGCLYFGLMLTEEGPKVIEYNCRFGDPETQVVLPLLDTDLLTVFEAVIDEKLEDIDINGRTNALPALFWPAEAIRLNMRLDIR